jgi:hypothetical protein
MQPVRLRFKIMQRRFTYLSSVIAALAFPFLAAAQTAADIQDMTKKGAPLAPVAILLLSLTRIVNLLIPLVVSIALLAFFWGMTKFIANAGNETARARGRQLMVSGIIAFAVMSSLWGIVGFIQDSLGIGGQQTIAIPVAGGISQSP